MLHELIQIHTVKSILFFIFLYGGECHGQLSFADSIINRSSLRQSVLFLSQDSLKGRLTGSAGADEAAKFIAAKFDSIGLIPAGGSHSYFDHFTANYEGKKNPARNVMAMLPGKPINDSLVIFSAHYDHIGQKDDMPYNKEYNYKDEIYNGANDNATGVAALLELARYYKAQSSNSYSILFIAFSGEEMGMLGSNYLMKKSNPKIIKAVINLEMLGRPSGKSPFITEDDSRAFRKMLNANLYQANPSYGQQYFVSDPYSTQNLFERSDNFPFHLAGIPANTIMATDPYDKYYHSSADHATTLDYEAMTKIVQAIADAVLPFIKGQF